MKITTLFSLLAFQTTTTLMGHLSNGDNLIEAAVVSAFCILAYTVGEYVLRKDFAKSDVKRGMLIGVFMGLLTQVLVYFKPEWTAYFTIGAIVFCLSPQFFWDKIMSVVSRKSDKL